MAVRFIMGRSGTGKTTFCLNEISEKLQNKPEGPPIIYIVPDQMTFLSEYKLITSQAFSGMIRAQVFSFSRLAWRVLQETGGISRYHLNSTGIKMLIRKIIEEHKNQLHLFRQAADKNGFIEKTEQMLSEFKRYCIVPEELAAATEKLAQNRQYSRALADKLHDLQLIYSHFEARLSNVYIDSEDYFRLLAEKAAQSSYIKQAEIYIDGFYSYTPQEYMVIEQLFKLGKNITITLTVDQSYHESVPSELQLFRMSGESCQTLYEIAKTNNLKTEEVWLKTPKRWQHAAFSHLEAFFDVRPASQFQDTAPIQIGQAANRRAELAGTARKIIEIVREKGWRYRDIAVLVRNSADYLDLIETTFQAYEIPFFIDQKKTMLNHPVIEFIRSTLEIITGHWRYEAVFRAVKTELLFPLRENGDQIREKMDRLENYVLAYGIEGNRWMTKAKWQYRRIRGLEFARVGQTNDEKEIEQQINEMRFLISEPILRLSGRLKKAKNGRQLCEALFTYLAELEIPEKLEQKSSKDEEKGNLVKAREHEQAWNGIIDLLDQFVEILGDETLTVKQFSSILDAGLESLHFSLVPVAIDQIIIADIEMSRLSDIKAAFVIGLNDGVLPAKFPEDGLLADDDRQMLRMNGLTLAPESRVKLLDEDFLAYKAFTTPSDCLFISYPIANDEGKALMPSIYVKRISDMFPYCEKQHLLQDPADLPAEEQLSYIANMNTTLSYLTAQLQVKKRGYPIEALWWDVYNFYFHDFAWKEKAQKVLKSLTYQNRAIPLSDKTSADLYGEQIQASVSRMELFQSCPFSHFAQYGLKLRDRSVFRLEAPDIGELFHGALKYIADAVRERKISWKELTKESCENLAREAVEKLAPQLQHEILFSTNRHVYLKRKLEQIISRASYILGEHAKRSGFSPIALELPFGPQGKLPPLTFPLVNGTKMNLIGRIDRVDKGEDDNGVYLRVIDYKSSAKKVDINEIYHGLSLQMLTYLDLVVANANTLIGSEAIPAGVLYFHIHNPFIQTNKLLSFDEMEQEIFKSFKMNGLLLSEKNIVKLMDQELENGESAIISAGLKKDGNLSKRSKVANRSDFEKMRKYVHHLYEQAGNEILNGNVQISPYKLKDRTPCTYCSFKSVCQFDESVTDNHYRFLPDFTKEEALEMIRKEVDHDGESRPS
ncbi:helicase-exonuclease AddAB subunit AddB [Bacillaceae bacterium Marseille-Q3522]|nr:helicase-exonuclease AddAB subunit AddB [Bacillaceae bacterium Marseille-Q3522]